MTDHSPRSFFADFKLFFVRGLVVLLPSVLTLWIVVKAYQFIDTAIAEPINRGIRLVMYNATPHWSVLRREFEPTDEEIAAERARLVQSGRRNLNDSVIRGELVTREIEVWWDTRFLGAMNLVGLIVAITSVYIAGRLLGGFFGRRIYRRLERAITSLPVVKQVYPSVKQVVDFLFGQDRQIQFNRVVLVEYPRKGIWSVGLGTGAAMKSVQDVAGEESMTIFIPSSPTPFTGYTITVPRRNTIDLPITIDEALKFVVSGGVLLPKGQVPPGAESPTIEQPRSPEMPSGLIPITDPEDDSPDGKKPDPPKPPPTDE